LAAVQSATPVIAEPEITAPKNIKQLVAQKSRRAVSIPAVMRDLSTEITPSAADVSLAIPGPKIPTLHSKQMYHSTPNYTGGGESTPRAGDSVVPDSTRGAL